MSEKKKLSERVWEDIQNLALRKGGKEQTVSSPTTFQGKVKERIEDLMIEHVGLGLVIFLSPLFMLVAVISVLIRFLCYN